MKSNNFLSRLFLTFSLLILPFIAQAGNKVAPPLRTDPSQVSRTALGGIGRSATWVVQVSSAATVDAWAAATVPAELVGNPNLATRQAVVNIAVEHCDTTDTTVPVCVRLGPATNVPALDCAAGATLNGKPLNNLNALFQYQVRQIFDQASTADSSVPIWIEGRTATVVDVCITATW